MDFKHYKEQLAEICNRSGDEGLFNISKCVEPISAPYDNFFGNDLFLLLFHNKDILPARLEEIKLQLHIVTGDSVSRTEQGGAAIKLGRHVQTFQVASAKHYSSMSEASKWFDLAATHCESVIGLNELAKEKLSSTERLVIVQNLNDELLPRLIQLVDNDSFDSCAVSSRISDLWKRGMRLALDNSTSDFSNWDKECIDAAITCIVNFLIFKPKTTQKLHTLKSQSINLDILKWAVPTWNRLIEALADKDQAKQLKAQQKAVLMVVKDGSEINGIEEIRLLEDCIKSEDEYVVVIKGVIAPSSDRDDVKQLEQYEALRKPLKLISLPNLDGLKIIRTKLQDEFPWAKDAIAITMAEMFARKIHGSKRMGMQPILLAGLPGTGKTRFAQRLSELLGAPNTVINMSGMTDVKVLKGVTRGWASNRPSRIVEFIRQSQVANPLFILDEVDKAHGYANGGNPQDALLDLVEPGNAKRYSDIYLMTECDVSHALYILTANSLEKLSEPLKSRLQIVFFQAPGPEHTPVIVRGILNDLEKSWNIPAGTLHLKPEEIAQLVGLSPREMKRAILEIQSQVSDRNRYILH